MVGIHRNAFLSDLAITRFQVRRRAALRTAQYKRESTQPAAAKLAKHTTKNRIYRDAEKQIGGAVVDRVHKHFDHFHAEPS
jgi:hypothetical protein